MQGATRRVLTLLTDALQVVLDGMASAADTLSSCFGLCPNMDVLANALATGGLQQVEACCQLTIGESQGNESTPPFLPAQHTLTLCCGTSQAYQ